MTSASSIVTSAADQLRLDPKEFISKLEKESVTEAWQLEYLDSVQWQTLGVPMGLVAAIRRSLDERKHRRSTVPSPPETMDSTFVSPIPTHSSIHHRKKMLRANPSMVISLDDMEGGNNQDSLDASASSLMIFSPCRSVSSTISTLRPPAMPLRKESERGVVINEEGDDDCESDTYVGLNESLCNLESRPPVCPQRILSNGYDDGVWEEEFDGDQ